MAPQKILGLDLGTNSIGWAVVEQHDNKFELIDKGTNVFPEGVKIEKGNEKSRAAERTGYRSARKLYFRRKLRKYYTLKTLIEHSPSLCPLPAEELENWRKSNFKTYPSDAAFLEWLRTDESSQKNPYFDRYKFSKQKENWETDQNLAYGLGRAFYHFAQRRGFASNRKDSAGEEKVEDLRNSIKEILEDSFEFENPSELKDQIQPVIENFREDIKEDQKVRRIVKGIDKVLKQNKQSINELIDEIERILDQRQNLGTVQKGILELDELIASENCETLGQLFCKWYTKDRTNPEYKIRTRYTDREKHYLKEFNLICDKQHIPNDLRSALKKAIFYQRPLKSKKGLVGRCSFEPNKSRCPASHPAYEEYRMWSLINNIKIKTPDDDQMRPLSEEERERIRPLFHRVSKKTFPFSDIAKKLFGDNKYAFHRSDDAKWVGCVVNYQQSTTISGCPTTAALMNLFGRSWEDQKQWVPKLAESWKNRKLKNGQEKSETEIVNDVWHALFNADLLGDKKEQIGKSRQDKLREFITNKTRLSEEQAEKFSKIKPLASDYANLSLNAIHKILPWLKQGLLNSHAVFMANMHKVVDTHIWKVESQRNQLLQTVKQIIDNHSTDVTQINAINELIRHYKDNEYRYNAGETSNYRTELENVLKQHYGEKSWNQKTDRTEVVNEALEIFTRQLGNNGRATQFAKVMRIEDKIKAYLSGDNQDGEVFCSDEKRLKKLYHPSDIEHFTPKQIYEKGTPVLQNGEPLTGLGSPMVSGIKNPVVMRSMHQVRKLVNELLKEGIIDHNTRIHIELARELNDANRRQAIQRYQRELENKRAGYREEIIKLYKEQTGKDIDPTDDDILKYTLWQEQKTLCIYTDDQISLTDFIGADPKYDIEHTIPKSVSYDNSQANKTLCQRAFNRDTKGNKMPSELDEHEEILQRIEHWKKESEKLQTEIDNLTRRTKAATTKEQKDRLIQERHYLSLKKDYWKDKYHRFEMTEVKAGFKNSQKVDTSIITKYTREFLGSVFRNRNGFPNVYTVNGQMVDEFRKAWGMHAVAGNSNGGFDYEKKERGNHVHHCLDAVVIACMTRDKYDVMAHAWKLEEKQELQQARKVLENSKPWPSFTKDMQNLKDEIPVVHIAKDNVPKHTRKKLRKRGKIQYKDAGKTQPVYQEGDTARGSLHQDSYYGRIIDPETGEKCYVIRRSLDELKDSEVEKIVDRNIREIVKDSRAREKELKKTIDDLKKQEKKVTDEEAGKLKQEIERRTHTIENKLYRMKGKDGEPGKPIRKVRIRAKIASPLENFKQHRDTSVHKHKQQVYVANDENYAMVLYEHPGSGTRKFEIIRNIDAVRAFKKSSRDGTQDHPLINEERNGYFFKGFLKKNTLVLFYQDNTEELHEMTTQELVKRLYRVKKINKDGRVLFQFNQDARDDNLLKDDYEAQFGQLPPKALINGFSSIDFEKLPNPRFLLSKNNLNLQIEGQDFKLSLAGKIKWIK